MCVCVRAEQEAGPLGVRGRTLRENNPKLLDKLQAIGSRMQREFVLIVERASVRVSCPCALPSFTVWCRPTLSSCPTCTGQRKSLTVS